MEQAGRDGKDLAGVEGDVPQPRPVDPEVFERPVRRSFTAEYKRRILEEADRCTAPGELGALLRREGLYSSHLTTWRKQRERAMLSGLAPRKRGRKGKRRDPLEEENRQLRRRVERLEQRLQQAEAIIDFQKKLSEILGIRLGTPEDDETDE
jgi:transposase